VGVKKLTAPLTLTLSVSGEGRKKGLNTPPLTFVLSRKGREEKKDERKRMTLSAPLTFILSRREREEGKENDFNGTSHFNYFSLGEKGKES
jgi:hypothetical protein